MLTITVQNSRGRTAVSSFQLSFSAPLTLIKIGNALFQERTQLRNVIKMDDQSAVSETLIVAGSEGVQKKLENVGPRWMSSCC